MLNLSPWAARELSVEEHRDLTLRALDLGVTVIAILGTRTGWTLRVLRGPSRQLVVDSHGRHGPLAGLIASVLDEYERTLFTPEELLVIAAQSGLEVSRA